MSEIEQHLHTRLQRIREEIDALLATLAADQPLPRVDLASRGITELLATSEDLTISIRKHTVQEEIAELHQNIQLQASREAQLREEVQELHAERTVLLDQIETSQGAVTEVRQLRALLARAVAERNAAYEASRGPRDVWRQEGSHETHEARRHDLAGALGVAESTDWVAMIGLVEQLRNSAERADWVAMIGLVEQLHSRATNRGPPTEPAQEVARSADPSA